MLIKQAMFLQYLFSFLTQQPAQCMATRGHTYLHLRKINICKMTMVKQSVFFSVCTPWLNVPQQTIGCLVR